MTTRSGARIYRGPNPPPLQPDACPHCGRVVAITTVGRRRRHLADGRPCTGGGIHVDTGVRFEFALLPAIDLDEPREPPQPRGPRPPRQAPPPREPVVDPRRCVCGWRPRRKGDGTFAAHRTEPDNPAAPYCPNGAARTW